MNGKIIIAYACLDLVEFGLVRNVEEKWKREQGYKKYAFNVLISDNIGLRRHLPDTRNELCKEQKYNLKNLPNASIVMCFYNEHYTTLLRSILGDSRVHSNFRVRR